MDWRWQPCGRDTRRDIKVILHPTASIPEIRRGLDPGSDDSVDLSEFVTAGSQSAFECTITLEFNRELFGDAQPKSHQILEIQLKDQGEFKTCWLGIIGPISNYILERGKRSMQLIARSRDSHDVWRNTKRVTPLFPQLTELTYIAMRIARSAGLQGDEILLPPSSYTTAHSNTQLADMNAWDMLESVFLPIGWTPFIDCLGRLRAAQRGLQGRQADLVLDDSRLIKVGGQKVVPPKSRVRVLWLDPILKKDIKQGQMLASETITLGWFLPYWKQTVYFSDDRTQRAEGTYMRPNPSANLSIGHVQIGYFVRESWKQQAENKGKLSFVNLQTYAVAAMLAASWLAHQTPDPVVTAGVGATTGETVPTVPTSGSYLQGLAEAALIYMLLAVGTGKYEIWGNPYDWVHARNISEAFDSSVPVWVDNSVDVESDFIVNEEHAKAVAIRELIYQARAANKWSVTMADDPRIEYGDILEFTDGSQLFVEDFKRSLERGSTATLEISGFQIPVTKIVPGSGQVGSSASPPVVVTPPPTGGGDPPTPPIFLPLPELL